MFGAAMRVRLRFLCSNAALTGEAVSRQLAEVGIQATPPSSTTPSVAELVLFDAMCPALCALLHEASATGSERILAVAVPGTAVRPEGIWELLDAGAADVLVWDTERNPPAEIAARLDRWQTVDELLASPAVHSILIGKCRTWISTLREIVEVAYFTHSSVLITGETGTGKELVARLIHSLDQRSQKGSFVVLDCTTIVPELSGSEFFGHERGAFTGALGTREGAFALADGGTLFLDEVGELPLALQAEILRVIQEGTYKRVGSNLWQRARFRLVCATNRDLAMDVACGQFRTDLFYRIATWSFRLPPLRDRVEDVLPLVQHFVREERQTGEVPDLDDSVQSYLLTREYPGNVRDLRQLVARMMSRHVGPGPITAGDIPKPERPLVRPGAGGWQDQQFTQCIRRALASGAGLKEIGRSAEETAIRLAVQQEGGSLQKAARRLRVTDRALQLRRAAQQHEDPPS